MAVRRVGDLDRRQPERLDRRFRPPRAKAPYSRIDGQRRAALRRRLLVSVLSCDGALRRRTARAGPTEDRANRGGAAARGPDRTSSDPEPRPADRLGGAGAAARPRLTKA